MDNPAIGPKTWVLKVNLHCSACERKVHKALRKINGVCSIGIVDRENGKITVTGNVDPHTLILALAKEGKKAEVLWQHSPSPNPTTSHNETHGPQNPNPIKVGVDPQVNAAQMALLHQLSQLKSLEEVELTHSKSITMKFKGHGSDEPAHKSETLTTKKIAIDSNVGHGAAGPCPCPTANGYYGTNVDAHHNHYQHHCCHGVGGPSSRASGVPHEYFNGCGPPPPSRRGVPPVAPPPVYNWRAAGPPPEAMPPVAYPYPNLVGDNSPGGCKLM